MTSLLAGMKERGDFVELESSDDYARYFNHLTRVFQILISWYKNLIDGGATEERLVTGFLKRMLFNVDMLRLKHYHNPHNQPHLDLNASGFPHILTIMELEADLRIKPERLPTLSPRNTLIELMLNEMFEKRQEPIELLRQMAETEYYTLLDENKLLLAFTPGVLELREDRRPGYRKYQYSWACYDPHSNMIHMHLFAFDHDKTEEPLQSRGPAFNRFLQVIKTEGSRAPTVGVLASSIDEALISVHPKVLKRVRIGPITCPRFSRESNPESMLGFLKQYGEEDDFAVRLASEIIISERQVERSRGLLSFGRAKRVREHFAIPDPDADLQCFTQQASQVYDHLFLPHAVLQEVVGDPNFAPYEAMQKVVYTRKGELHAV
jgi:hypothetical protein